MHTLRWPILGGPFPVARRLHCQFRLGLLFRSSSSGCDVLQSLPSEAEDLVDKLPTDQEAAAFPEVVRTKTFVLEPMTLEDALEQVPFHCTRCLQESCLRQNVLLWASHMSGVLFRHIVLHRQ